MEPSNLPKSFDATELIAALANGSASLVMQKTDREDFFTSVDLADHPHGKEIVKLQCRSHQLIEIDAFESDDKPAYLVALEEELGITFMRLFYALTLQRSYDYVCFDTGRKSRQFRSRAVFHSMLYNRILQRLVAAHALEIHGYTTGGDSVAWHTDPAVILVRSFIIRWEFLDVKVEKIDEFDRTAVVQHKVLLNAFERLHDIFETFGIAANGECAVGRSQFITVSPIDFNGISTDSKWDLIHTLVEDQPSEREKLVKEAWDKARKCV